MEYLVHIESCNYHLWQVGLLIESLRQLGVEDSLVITYSGDGEVPFNRAYSIDHIGQTWKVPNLTKMYAAMVALRDGIIKQPFVVLEPDMILRKAIEQSSKPLAAQQLYWMGRPDIELVREYSKLPTDKWYPVGEVYQFNDVKVNLFEDIITTSLFFTERHKTKWKRDIVSIALALSRSGYECEVVRDYESTLDHKQIEYDPQSHIIHYSKGFSPYFQKQAYDDRRLLYRAPFPWQDIANIPIGKENPHVKTLKKIAKSFADRNSDHFTS